MAQRRDGVWEGEQIRTELAFSEEQREKKERRVVPALSSKVKEHRVKQIIVGLPLRLDGTRGEMAEDAERFAQRAAKQTGVRVEMVDERLTSWEAERLREEEFGRVGHRGARAKAWSVDAVAAAVILREYLERQGTADERAKSARAE